MAYVYRHIRLDKNEPFYIGIGKENDGNYYRASSKCNRNKMWWNIVNKTAYEVDIIYEHHDYNFIKKKEIEFIGLYGRRQFKTGCLVNMTKGGDGITGRFITEDVKKRLSESKKGKNHPMYGKKLSPDTKEKIRIANIGKRISDLTRKRISDGLKGKKAHNKGVPMKKEHYVKLIERSEQYKIKVAKYRLSGDLDEIYDSVISAAKLNGLQQGNITNSFKRTIMYGGYIWRYSTNGEFPLSIPPYTLKVKPILQKKLTGELVSEYTSFMEAARKNGWVKSTIMRAAKRKNNIAYNFKWEYKK